jgi:hypothetical protein
VELEGFLGYVLLSILAWFPKREYLGDFIFEENKVSL